MRSHKSTGAESDATEPEAVDCSKIGASGELALPFIGGSIDSSVACMSVCVSASNSLLGCNASVELSIGLTIVFGFALDLAVAPDVTLPALCAGSVVGRCVLAGFASETGADGSEGVGAVVEQAARLISRA